MHEPSTAPSRTPPVDMIGNYVLAESTQKVNPRDGMTYEVSAGEYPVMGLLSADRTRVENAGIIFERPIPRRATSFPSSRSCGRSTFPHLCSGSRSEWRRNRIGL